MGPSPPSSQIGLVLSPSMCASGAGLRRIELCRTGLGQGDAQGLASSGLMSASKPRRATHRLRPCDDRPLRILAGPSRRVSVDSTAIKGVARRRRPWPSLKIGVLIVCSRFHSRPSAGVRQHPFGESNPGAMCSRGTRPTLGGFLHVVAELACSFASARSVLPQALTASVQAIISGSTDRMVKEDKTECARYLPARRAHRLPRS